MTRSLKRTVAYLAVLSATGCTTFAAPRSARVQPGNRRTLRVSASTPTGDRAGWFWSLDCGASCSHSVGAIELGFTRGVLGPDDVGYELGGGVNGTQPYVEAYRQLRGDSLGAFGVGMRVGLALGAWSEHRVEVRYDRRLSNEATLLLDPAVMLHVGNSPNGQNPGGFLAFTPALGLQLGGGRHTLTSGVAWVLGRGWRSSYGQDLGAFTASFVVASVQVGF